MARNRKRSKGGRVGPSGPGRPAVATARANGRDDDEAIEAPPPLEHAVADVDLANAQLAIGRPEEGDVSESELEAEEKASESATSADVADELEEDRQERVRHSAEVVKREPMPTRLVNFLQGSWRELQRVQWPDRRQVMQATGVVLGFVIVAGLYLGAADAVANKIVNFILK